MATQKMFIMTSYIKKVVQVPETLDDLNLYGMNKVPGEVKYLGIAMYFQILSLKKDKVPPDIHLVSKRLFGDG